PHASARLVERLAVLERHRARDVVEALLHQILEREEEANAVDRWRASPSRKRLQAGLHSAVHVGGHAQRHPGQQLVGHRVAHLSEARRVGTRPRASDVMVKLTHGGLLRRLTAVDRRLLARRHDGATSLRPECTGRPATAGLRLVRIHPTGLTVGGRVRAESEGTMRKSGMTKRRTLAGAAALWLAIFAAPPARGDEPTPEPPAEPAPAPAPHAAHRHTQRKGTEAGQMPHVHPASPQKSKMFHFHHEDMPTGMFGPYPLMRESSGTSWQPESSLHEGLHFARGTWTTMVHGWANAVWDHQGGPRGDEKI